MTDNMESAKSNAAGWLASIEEMLAAYNAKAQSDDYCTDSELSAIHESVLSVLVRNGWHEPGNTDDDGPDEYEILLTTGGPALRIWGKIGDHFEPSTAELQMQDWGTPWTRYPAPEATLLEFAQHFYFG